jgi:hypothetical protein
VTPISENGKVVPPNNPLADAAPMTSLGMQRRFGGGAAELDRSATEAALIPSRRADSPQDYNPGARRDRQRACCLINGSREQ